MRRAPRWLKNGIISFLDRRGYRLQRTDHAADPFFERLLERRLERKGRLTFVQIGANDGVSFDPLHDFIMRHRARVRGVVMEPLADKFELLCRTYAALPNVTKVRAAIHNHERRMRLHRVDPARERALPGWNRGIASFDPRHHERTRTPSRDMISEEVECLPLAEVLRQHDLGELDVLVTDTEGYDREIVMALEPAGIRPAILHFEHGMSVGLMTPEAFLEIADRLHAGGYSLRVLESDAVAFLPG